MAVVFVYFAAYGGHSDVDFAFVLLIELTADQGFVEAGLEGADDTRHLCGQDADGTLELADGHGGLMLEEIEGEELGFGELVIGGIFGGQAIAPGDDRNGEDFLGHHT